MTDKMPLELQSFYDSLPSVSVNNSRSIVKGLWERVKKLHPVTAVNILRKRLGVDVDIDFTPGKDDGEPPVDWDRLDETDPDVYEKRHRTDELLSNFNHDEH